MLALAQPASESSESAAQSWLSATASSIHSLASARPTAQQPLSRHRGSVHTGSASSLADSSQTHQHMDTASSDAAMSEDEWSHIDQRGSFSSLDSCITNSSSAAAAQQQAAKSQDSHNHFAVDHNCPDASEEQAHPQDADADAHSVFKLARSKQQYLQDVAACQQALYDGDSYEICLTTALVRPEATDALQLYRTLRKVNPAPYAAWMSFGADDLQICCSSPERFLKGGRGRLLEARPIKGTAPRCADPEQDKAAAVALANSEKDQAENLMIVDLLRNDLGRVCQACSQLPISCDQRENHLPHLCCLCDPVISYMSCMFAGMNLSVVPEEAPEPGACLACKVM